MAAVCVLRSVKMDFLNFCIPSSSIRWVLPICRLLCAFLSFLCGCCFFVISTDPSIEDYRTPSDCAAYYTPDFSGVSLACEVPYINSVGFLENVSSTYTQFIQVKCTQQRQHLIATSSLQNVSFSHLRELQELLLLDCKFLELPRETFQNSSSQLRNVTISCSHQASHSLTIEETSLQPLIAVQMLNLTSNNIKHIPRGELCYLTQLQELILNNNSLTNMKELGFSECGQPSTGSCGHRLKIMELAFNRFTVLSDDGLASLSRLQRLSFRGNLIREVQPRAFANLSDLVHLDLSLNTIGSIPSDTWTGVSSLKVLSMSRNDLSGGLDGSTFAGLSDIEQLDLSANRIEFLAVDTFKNLTQLTHLYLSTNAIKLIVGGTFRSLTQLTNLFLDHNNILVLTNDSLAGLRNLTVLMLNDNHLTQLEELALVSKPLLNTISLENNHLFKMPNFQGLSNLEILNMANNSIKDVPENAFLGLRNLTQLSLKSNAMKTIPEGVFVDLQNLILLNLAYNGLNEIPKSLLSANKRLMYLNLSHNKLASIVGLNNNPNLIYLDVSGNLLGFLDFGLLPPSLIYLLANQNRISGLQTKFDVADRVKIRELHLAYNQITVIRSNSFPSAVQILDLQWNNISHIDSNAFMSMTSLKKVSLVANRLMEMTKWALSTSSSLQRPTFELSGNPLGCTCNMFWIKNINFVSNKMFGFVADLDALYCWLPKRRDRGRRIKLISSVSMSEFECDFRLHEFADFLCFRLPSTNKTVCDAKCPNRCLCLHNQNWGQVTVDCHNANWTAVQLDIPAMSTVLYLDGNSFVELDQNSFEEYPNLVVLYLNASNIHVIRNYTFVKMTKLKVLHLDSNHLRTVTNGMLSGPSHLEELFLSSNLLDHIDEDMFQLMQSLKRLELQNNHLVHYPVWTLDNVQNLSLVSLSRNPWSCDCNYLQKYWNWLQYNAGKVLDIDNLTCYSDRDNSTLPVIGFNDSVCIPDFPVTFASHLPVVIVMLVLFFTIITMGVLLFIYRHEMQVLIYSRYGLRLFYSHKEVNDESKLYDAFVCYSNVDEEFVVQQLIPNLEGIEFPYKLCLHQRDFAAGSFITESILDAVEYSRRTVIVFTDGFLKSDWCRFEFKIAHLQMLKDRCSRVVLIVRDEIPDDLDAEMKLYLKTNTYLRWDDKLFWQKLYFALPEKKPKT